MSAPRILIVDDSPTQLAALEGLLEEHGFESGGASSGEEAIRRLRSEAWDLVLSDVVMPGMSGYELCRAIKSDEELDPVPSVVLLTSLSDPRDIVRGLEGGADNYITKPYEPEILVERLRQVLETRELRSQREDGDGVTIRFLGRTFHIDADREQILALLLSSFEELVRTNKELAESKQALARAHDRELEAEQLARRNAEDTADRMELFARAGAAFSSAGDEAELHRRLTALLVPELAETCLVCALDGEGAVRSVMSTPHEVEQAEELAGNVCRSLSDEAGATVLDPLPEGLPAPPPGADATAFAVPMIARGRRLGIVVLVTEAAEEDLHRRLAMADEVVGRAALAADGLRLLEQEKEARTTAEAAIRLRDDVLATVTHDLRNPIGVVVSGAALLVELGEQLTPEKRASQLEAIHRSAMRANRLIGDLLDVSTMESGRFSVDPEPTDPGRLMAEAGDMMGTLAEEKSIALDLVSGTQLPPVAADRARILQVFSNLIGNAVKYSPEGSRVTVEAAAEDDMVVFSVTDEGPGIAPENLPHIFDRFWQATDREKAGGAGLGLAIVKGIVDAHGGEVTASSEVEEGSTFTFSLPVATAAEEV